MAIALNQGPPVEANLVWFVIWFQLQFCKRKVNNQFDQSYRERAYITRHPRNYCLDLRKTVANEQTVAKDEQRKTL